MEDQKLAVATDALRQIDSWARAYPLDAFPEPDLRRAAELLAAGESRSVPCRRAPFYVMDRGYIDFARLYVLHRAGAFFVTRAKSNLDAHRVYSAPTDRAVGIIADQTRRCPLSRARAGGVTFWTPSVFITFLMAIFEDGYDFSNGMPKVSKNELGTCMAIFTGHLYEDDRASSGAAPIASLP